VSAELAAIVVGEDATTLRPLLRSLDRQTAKDRLELVVVAPADAHAEIERAAPAGMAGLRLVEHPRIDSLPAARVAGIRVATAPVVVFTETHCFPEPEWAGALIERHREDCAAVGPSFVNCNPGRTLSWANLVLDYGRFLARPERTRPEPSDDLPGHNSSYKRELMLAYGEELAPLILAESALHADLIRRGHVLVFEPAARTRHINVTRWRSWLPERRCAGRLYAAGRSRAWSRPRRLAYAAGWPLIVVLRLRRALGHARSVGGRRLAVRAAPLVFLGLVAQSAAEAAGYLAGPGEHATGVMMDMELNRFRHLAPGDTWLDPARAVA
jgi:hypothetical protein